MYKPINGWTKQGIIDHIRKEFKGVSMIHGGGMCAYRGENGTKCAVGMFIPDSEYKTEFEGTVFWRPSPFPGMTGNTSILSKKYPHLQNFMPLTNDAMDVLQTLHDSCQMVNDRKDALPNIIKFVEENVEDT